MRLVLGHLMMKDLAKVSKNLMSLSEFGRSADNTLQLFLTPESESNSQFTPRQVKNIHFSYVKTEPVPNPYFVAASASCAQSIGLDPNEFTKQSFIDAFSGNTMLPGLDKAYCTVYGCHCYGHWFGQLGDGRAMGIGEVEAKYGSYLTDIRIHGSIKLPRAYIFCM